ncbi:Exocyst complex component EXO70B1, partial [Mucuna pruriens]
MLLERTREYFKDESELAGMDHNFVIDALPLGKINDLHETIKLMVGDGFEKECCDVYCNWRRESLTESLMNLLGVQGVNIVEKREQREFQYYIFRWMKAVNVALRILFPSERQLCDRIFMGFSSVAGFCFTEVCRGATIQLLNFAEAVASGSPSEWRLSKTLDMFDTLRRLIPEFQSLFPESLVKEVMIVHDKLGEASRDIFMNMENVIFHIPEAKVVAPPDGRVHLMTKYVIRHLVFASRAKHILEQILEQYPKFANEVGKSSSVSDLCDRIVKQLETKLVTMSKIYENPALRYFFLMNNWRYMELETSKLILDLDCFQQDTTKVRQNLQLYQSSSWNMVLEFLKLENSELVVPNANAESLKGNLNLFNMHFKDICSTQSRWFAFDKQLSEEIIISLQNILLPAYGNFIGRFHHIHGKHASEYIKYGLSDIRDQLNHLFLGSTPMNQYLKEKERLPLSTQIKRWLMQVAVWRFVGFVSTIVGLLCYALSSSFNNLFGDWNSLKILLYEVCQHSPSLRFKAHSAFLVLTITSVYSYFADKVVNGKPDAYSLISCAAFAIMSFSLSRQTQCGFEMDSFYFFLGCLIVQLLKINLALAIVGIGLSYGLIILRSSLDTTSYQNLGVQDEHPVVIHINSLTDNASLMQQLMACIKALQQGNSKLTDMLFKHVKESLDKIELADVDYNFVIDALPSGKVNDLHETIKLMMGVGFAKECCDVYCNWRRESFKECLMNLLGLPEINIEEKLEGVGFKDYIIVRRIEAIKVALTTLFPNERRLCDRVFEGFPSVARLCFTDVCRGATIQLLNIAHVFTSGIPLNWRLFEILRVFEAWIYLIPEFQLLFPESLVNEAMAIRDDFGEANRDVLMKVINMTFLYPEKSAMAFRLGLHVMTIDVMSYLISSCLAQQTSEHKGAGTSSFSMQIDRIMKHLDRKLVVEYKNMNPAARYFFMMNNWRFVEISSQQPGFDLDCFKKYRTKVRQNLELYRRSSWNVVLEFLKLENNELVEPNAESLKDNLESFNMCFNDICSTQSGWLTFDEQLSKEIIISLHNILLPAYGNFIARFQDILGKHAYKYIKYGMFDIQDHLNQLFIGEMPKTQRLKENEKLLMLIGMAQVSN